VRYIWLVIQVGSTLYPPLSVASILGNWLNIVNHKFKLLIRMKVLTVFGRYSYLEMTRFLHYTHCLSRSVMGLARNVTGSCLSRSLTIMCSSRAVAGREPGGYRQPGFSPMCRADRLLACLWSRPAHDGGLPMYGERSILDFLSYPIAGT
jgi:hypothetical protein